MSKNVLICFSLILFLLLSSCNKDPVISPIQEETFRLEKPAHFPEIAFEFKNNPTSKEKFKLGRYLFYDPILSLDSSISCNTCHAQTHGFADHNIPLSKGINGFLSTRNAPSIFNIAWMPNNFMWDGGVDHLEKFPVFPITNPFEMGETMENILKKLSRNQFYKNLFKNAYGNEEITEHKLMQALAQFMVFIVSSNSKYDDVKKGNTTFTEKENNGYQLFKLHCATCHKEPLFTDFSYRNNGLDEIVKDLGREIVTKNNTDRGKFKVPTLRNIDFTYPYMHDGRFISLSEVIEHYTSGIKASQTLDPTLVKGIVLTSTEKKELIAFLRTLNDFKLLGDTLVAEPRYNSLTENHK
jgi:cytochrome c peroxidase